MQPAGALWDRQISDVQMCGCARLPVRNRTLGEPILPPSAVQKGSSPAPQPPFPAVQVSACRTTVTWPISRYRQAWRRGHSPSDSSCSGWRS